MIYFLQCGDHGRVKIGTCKDGGLTRRIQALRTGSPDHLRVLGTMDGGAEFERCLHDMFWQFRKQGEWFDPDPVLLDFIRENARPDNRAKKQYGSTPIARAIGTLGGVGKAATALGIDNPSVVANWRTRGRVPAEKVLDVEAATGISRHELRADIFGPAPEAA